MKKNYILTAALFASTIIGLNIQAQKASTAWRWVKIKNRSGNPLRIWWGKHRTYYDKDNFIRIPNRGKKTLLLRDKEAMNGPLFFQEAKGKDYKVKTTHIRGIDYEIINEVPKAYFYPINKKMQLSLHKTLEISPGGAFDFRVRQTWPPRWNVLQPRWPWVKAKAITHNPLTGKYEPLDALLKEGLHRSR